MHHPTINIPGGQALTRWPFSIFVLWRKGGDGRLQLCTRIQEHAWTWIKRVREGERGRWTASSYALASKSTPQFRKTGLDERLQLRTCIQEYALVKRGRLQLCPSSLELLEHTSQLHKLLPGEHKPQEGHTRCSSSSLNKRSTITIPFKKILW